MPFDERCCAAARGCEVYLELTHRNSIGQRVRQWATISPLLGAILLAVLGAFLGHFFGHEIVFRT